MTAKGAAPFVQSAMEAQVGIVWIIIIGLVVGIIARFISPGPNNPSGFILTALLGSRYLHWPGDRMVPA